MNQSDHLKILDSFFRYARVDYLDLANDTANLTILDGDLQPTSEAWLNVPIFFHCDPDRALKGNGSLEGAAKAFRINDVGVVKFEDESPTLVGLKDTLRRCAVPAAVFLRSDKFYLANIEGNPINGTAMFKDIWEWGSGKYVCFGCPNIRFNYYPFSDIDRYWLLESDGSVKYKQGDNVHLIKRDPKGEVTCTGLPSDITSFSVQIWDWTRYMVLSRKSGSDDIVEQYTSTDCKAWTFDSTIFSGAYGGETKMVHSSKSIAGTGYWFPWQETGFYEHYHMDHFNYKPTGHPPGYPNEYFRIWRIGVFDFWDDYGEANQNPRGFTCYADAYPTLQYTFEFENHFEVEGIAMDHWTQLLQVWGEYWLND